MTTHVRIGGNDRISGRGRVGPAPVNFTFDGTAYTGLAGDTVASALLANGVHLMGRSFKYHRPRGPISAGPEEPNALIHVMRDAARHTPNVRATMQEIYEGLRTTSQNRWPSLANDVGALNDRLAPGFTAGFYYKTFMWPRKAWEHVYEPFIRRAAGLGESAEMPDPDRYASRFAHCDVLVVGGGPAGLSAAMAAADTGARVILCDERASFGGSLAWDADATIDGLPGWDWARQAADALAAMPNVRMLGRTTAFGYYAQNFVSLCERITDHLAEPGDLPRERLWQVRAGHVILAQGAIERHMVHAGNDRPGIMLAGAARHYLNHHGVTVGRKVGLYVANDAAYAAAFDLADAGIQIQAIVDPRDTIGSSAMEGVHARGIRHVPGGAVTNTGGKLRVSAMTVETASGASEVVPVDALLHSAGWTPSVHLHSQARGKLRWDEAGRRFLPGVTVQRCTSIGACNGTDALDEAVREGLEAGERAANERGHVAERRRTFGAVGGASSGDGVLGAGRGAGAGTTVKAFTDFQNDVTAKDIRLAIQEGFESVEHVKRFTTNGMATDQGKLSNMHALAIAAETLGKPIPECGLTTFRSPFTPVTFNAIVGHAKGRLFDPERRTPVDATAGRSWAEENGAVFEPVSQWRRARYFPRAGEEMHAAVARECRTVRDAVGVFDASTLGKIEVVGPDAAGFMDLLYATPFAKLAPGRCRYGIMLREDGFIYDDGVVARVAEDRFHVTTTTGGAARVLAHMEDHLQTEFPHLKVWLTSTTEQWAVIAVQGPKARDTLLPFVEDVDLSADAFPHMGYREGRVCGVPARIFRVSFTGEVGFEVNVPADHGRAVWEAIHGKAVALGGCAYGTEAMHVLRAEKGYIIVGQDTDGTVTPDDAGLGWAVAKKKDDFVGIRGLQRADLVATGRKQLVGLRTSDPEEVLEEGAQIVESVEGPMKALGHVTSSYLSPTTGRSIAMALVAGGRERVGKTLHVPMFGKDGLVRSIPVEVLGSTVFHDPDGSRLDG